MQRLEALDLLDQVEAQVEPLELGERFEALNTRDDVVVKLELSEGLNTDEIVDFNNICIKVNNGYTLFIARNSIYLLLKLSDKWVNCQISRSSSSKILFSRLYSCM